MWSTEEKLNVNNIIYNSSTNYNLKVGDTWLLCPISNKNSVLGSIPAAGPQNEMCCCSFWCYVNAYFPDSTKFFK